MGSTVWLYSRGALIDGFGEELINHVIATLKSILKGDMKKRLRISQWMKTLYRYDGASFEAVQ